MKRCSRLDEKLVSILICSKGTWVEGGTKEDEREGWGKEDGGEGGEWKEWHTERGNWMCVEDEAKNSGSPTILSRGNEVGSMLVEQEEDGCDRVVWSPSLAPYGSKTGPGMVW